MYLVFYSHLLFWKWFNSFDCLTKHINLYNIFTCPFYCIITCPFCYHLSCLFMHSYLSWWILFEHIQRKIINLVFFHMVKNSQNLQICISSQLVYLLYLEFHLTWHLISSALHVEITKLPNICTYEYSCSFIGGYFVYFFKIEI